MTRRLLLPALATLALVALRPLSTADAWQTSDSRAALALSEVVDDAITAGPDASNPGPLGIAPGNEHFTGEWWFGADVMAAAGHGNLALQHPEQRAILAERCSRAVDAAISPTAWGFDTARWGDAALAHLDDDRHDHAVLGYLGVAMGLERLADPDNRHAALHDRVIAALSRRLQAGPILETYPGEAYPVDHSASLAAIALHADATGQPRPAWLQAHIDDWASRYVDDRGLVVQAASSATGAPRSRTRGSGSALAAWFLGYADPALAARISEGIHDELGDTVLGLGVVREYAPADCGGGQACHGDIDSGPLILGASIAATGFSLGAARRLGDDAWFRALWATTRTFGQPLPGGGFATGGPLGDAIMLAMLTTPRS